jgi:hypothetical protein
VGRKYEINSFFCGIHANYGSMFINNIVAGKIFLIIASQG